MDTRILKDILAVKVFFTLGKIDGHQYFEKYFGGQGFFTLGNIDGHQYFEKYFGYKVFFTLSKIYRHQYFERYFGGQVNESNHTYSFSTSKAHSYFLGREVFKK